MHHFPSSSAHCSLSAWLRPCSVTIMIYGITCIMFGDQILQSILYYPAYAWCDIQYSHALTIELCFSEAIFNLIMKFAYAGYKAKRDR